MENNTYKYIFYTDKHGQEAGKKPLVEISTSKVNKLPDVPEINCSSLSEMADSIINILTYSGFNLGETRQSIYITDMAPALYGLKLSDATWSYTNYDLHVMVVRDMHPVFQALCYATRAVAGTKRAVLALQQEVQVSLIQPTGAWYCTPAVWIMDELVSDDGQVATRNKKKISLARLEMMQGEQYEDAESNDLQTYPASHSVYKEITSDIQFPVSVWHAAGKGRFRGCVTDHEWQLMSEWYHQGWNPSKFVQLLCDVAHSGTVELKDDDSWAFLKLEAAMRVGAHKHVRIIVHENQETVKKIAEKVLNWYMDKTSWLLNLSMDLKEEDSQEQQQQ